MEVLANISLHHSSNFENIFENFVISKKMSLLDEDTIIENYQIFEFCRVTKQFFKYDLLSNPVKYLYRA